MAFDERRRYGYERVPGGAVPRNVDGMSDFGAKMAANSGRSAQGRPLPQLVYTDPEPAAMNLGRDSMVFRCDYATKPKYRQNMHVNVIQVSQVFSN